jgi:hypothetical protein
MNTVGGVAFDGVASPKPGYSVVNLRYRPEQSDGKRLEVVLDSGDRRQTVAASIYDWQLKPIAQFAATPDYACFTLFGELKDSADTNMRRSPPHHRRHSPLLAP